MKVCIVGIVPRTRIMRRRIVVTVPRTDRVLDNVTVSRTSSSIVMLCRFSWENVRHLLQDLVFVGDNSL